MSAPFHYSKEYYRLRRRAIGFGVPAIILTIIMIIIALMISFYNVSCAGANCDGSGVRYCSPSEYPGFFTFVFLFLAVDVAFVIASIYNIAQAKTYKIPIYYTAEELAEKVIYVNEYYKYRNLQTVFSILGGVTAIQIPGVILIVLDEINNINPHFYDVEGRIDDLLVRGGIAMLILAIVAVVFFLIANVNRKFKVKNAIRVTGAAFSVESTGENGSYTV